MLKLQFFAVHIAVWIAVARAATVSFIKPCKPDDNACIKESTIAAVPSFLAGIPELNVPAADPIVLDDVRADDKDLKLGFRNMVVTGVNKCKVLDMSRNLEKSTMSLSVECPITATGQYTLSGKLLILIAEGDGDFKIQTDKARFDVTLKIKEVDSNGKKHWKVTGFDYTYDIIEKAHIKLQNLFGGDETKSKPITEFFDRSWKEIITEIGGPIIKELISKEVNIVQKFFKAAPIEDLELS